MAKPVTIFNFRSQGAQQFSVNEQTGVITPIGTLNPPLTQSEKTIIYGKAGLGPDGKPLPASPQTTPNNNRGSTSSTTQNISGDATQQNELSIQIDDRLKLKEVLSYPKDLSKNQTYLQFTSYDYSTVSKTTTDIFSVANNIIVKKLVGESGKIQAFSSDNIKLYVPPGISVRYGADWGTGSLGAAGSSFIRSGNFLDTLANSTTSIIQGGVQKLADQVASVMAEVPGFGASGEQLIGLTTGLVFNRNEFSTFTRIPMRNFNYSFVFVARNREERDTINQIINCFKLGMLPFSKTDVANDIFGSTGIEKNQVRPPVLKYPKLWLIKYKKDNEDNIYLPISKFCALTSLNVNYTPNSVFTTLTDGAIPAIQIDLSFQELTPLTGDEVLEPGTLLASDAKISEGLESPTFSKNRAIGQDYKQQGATF